MPLISRIQVLIFFFFCIPTLSAQQVVINAVNIRESDPLLYNGKQYTFFVPSGTGGNQFYSGPGSATGTVTVRGVRYVNVMLNYDIYNQYVILQYLNSMGAKAQIVLSDAWLESFSLNDAKFELISHDSVKQIFEVIGTGHYRILYKWKKDLIMDGFVGSKNHTFTTARKEMNLYSDTKLIPFSNNRSFCALFAPGDREKIAQFLRQNRIKVKRADNRTMNGLVNFVNSIPPK